MSLRSGAAALRRSLACAGLRRDLSAAVASGGQRGRPPPPPAVGWPAPGLLRPGSARSGARWLSSEAVPAELTDLHELEEDLQRQRHSYDEELLRSLTPKRIIQELDKHVIGQDEAKRAVAIALRNRWRRTKVAEDVMKEIMPKNILMIGPSGCGKTEIARRLAKIAKAPFLKVEGTKYTEVGFHGKDVESMIGELVTVSQNLVKERIMDMIDRDMDRFEDSPAMEEKLLDYLVGEDVQPSTRETIRQILRSGEAEDTKVDVDMSQLPKPSGHDQDSLNKLLPSPNWLKDAFTNKGPMALQDNLFNIEFKVNVPQGARAGPANRTNEGKKKMTIRECREMFKQRHRDSLLSPDSLQQEAIFAVEQFGIVVIDEIDKIVSPTDFRRSGSDASSDGVQRDLLPLIEGCTVDTRIGPVKTDHILFICSGAFSAVKPSDMLTELQGRLPIRVSLEPLDEERLYRILTETENSLIAQQAELMKSEGLDLQFTDDALRALSRIAFRINEAEENTGARRLAQLVELVMSDLSLSADEYKGQTFSIDEEYVLARIGNRVKEEDFSKYIL